MAGEDLRIAASICISRFEDYLADRKDKSLDGKEPDRIERLHMDRVDREELVGSGGSVLDRGVETVTKKMVDAYEHLLDTLPESEKAGDATIHASILVQRGLQKHVTFDIAVKIYKLEIEEGSKT